MAPPSNMSKMKIRNKEIDFKYIGKATLCIAAGIASGLIVYGIFLYFKIAIFGWNLGLIFAPLTAGYVETVLANRILNNNLGAISAFIMFIHTTYYSFILKNPTLGMNIITVGSIVVILQSAFPTLVNYLLLVVIGAILSNFKWVFMKIGKGIKKVFSHIRWTTPHEEPPVEEPPYFDENESNKILNSLDFFFITSTDIGTENHENLGIFQSDVLIENKEEITVKRDEIENKRLVNLKEGKDKCLIKLANTIKEQGGNGVLDLNIEYGIIGFGGDHIHITATGMGIKL